MKSFTEIFAFFSLLYTKSALFLKSTNKKFAYESYTIAFNDSRKVFNSILDSLISSLIFSKYSTSSNAEIPANIAYEFTLKGLTTFFKFIIFSVLLII